MHHDTELRSPPHHANCTSHSQHRGLCVISVRIQNSEAAEECFLTVFLSSGVLLMFSVALGPKTLCKQNRKRRAAVPVARVCVFRGVGDNLFVIQDYT